jgi:hypothetical protein
MPHNGTGEGVLDMENNTGAKSFNGHFVPRKHFTPEREKPSRSKNYLDFLAHYDAELVQINGLIMVARCETGTELPLEQKGKLRMVTFLLDEFGTIDGTNQAIAHYKASHS